jgi:hypothetical protein
MGSYARVPEKLLSGTLTRLANSQMLHFTFGTYLHFWATPMLVAGTPNGQVLLKSTVHMSRVNFEKIWSLQFMQP